MHCLISYCSPLHLLGSCLSSSAHLSPMPQKLHHLQHSARRWEGQECDSELSQLLVVSTLNPEGLISSLPSFSLNSVLARNCLVCVGRATRI